MIGEIILKEIDLNLYIYVVTVISVEMVCACWAMWKCSLVIKGAMVASYCRVKFQFFSCVNHFVIFSYKKWVSLTNQITESLMLQLQPSNGKISSVTQLVSTPSNSKSRLEHLQSHGNSSSPREGQSSLKSAEANLPQMEVKKGIESHMLRNEIV